MTVATHEIGHSLGLAHSTKKSALMAPGSENLGIPQLDVDDVAAIQYLYGEPGEGRPHYDNIVDLDLIGMTDISVLVTNIRDYVDKLQKIETDLIKHITIIDKYDLKIPAKETSEIAFGMRRDLERNLEAIEKRGGESVNRSFHRKMIKVFYEYKEVEALKNLEKLSLRIETNLLQLLHLWELKDSVTQQINKLIEME